MQAIRSEEVLIAAPEKPSSSPWVLLRQGDHVIVVIPHTSLCTPGEGLGCRITRWPITQQGRMGLDMAFLGAHLTATRLT
jgi:hypothetical protein